ncbi:META domain-containing protein [Treponema sp. R80B11-R83G3]
MNVIIKNTIMIITMFLVSAIFSFAEDILNEDNVPFSKVQRIDWNLDVVRTKSAVITINRVKAQREIYSIRFQENSILRGRGADNIYFAPYTTGANNSFSIRKIASAYMVPIFETENFTEYEYFRHLERTYRWEFRDWKLKLYTYDENKEEVILEFIPIYK